MFFTEIPYFFLVILITILAFAGAHPSRRRFSISTIMKKANEQINQCEINATDPPRRQFFSGSILPSQTIYDLRRPLLSALILLLDGGAGLHEEDLLRDNFFFTLIYLSFAFFIIVLMLNILIAQFVYSYRKITNVNIYDYKYELLVDLELRDFFFFGKYFRRASSIEKVDMPLSVWNSIKKGELNTFLLMSALNCWYSAVCMTYKSNGSYV